jgi:hypothetical protein
MGHVYFLHGVTYLYKLREIIYSGHLSLPRSVTGAF